MKLLLFITFSACCMACADTERLGNVRVINLSTNAHEYSVNLAASVSVSLSVPAGSSADFPALSVEADGVTSSTGESGVLITHSDSQSVWIPQPPTPTASYILPAFFTGFAASVSTAGVILALRRLVTRYLANAD